MSTIGAGTSRWSHALWKPRFYPANLAAAKFLGYYATRLNTVESNCTFRSVAGEKSPQSGLFAQDRKPACGSSRGPCTQGRLVHLFQA
jgi:hypothetical protein